jgi:tRNA(fMet)-specific endonuclease VapC
MLDTNMVSYVVTGRSRMARQRLSGLGKDEAVCLSAITEAEVLYGVAKAKLGEQRRRSVEWFLARLQVYPWGREAASAYGVLRAKQEAAGKTLGPLDMQIAAHAIASGATLVSRDGAFRQVEGLVIEDWATDL